MLLSWHIAETREKAIAEAREGLLRHHNEYIVGTLQRPGAKPFKDPDEAIEKTAFSDAGARRRSARRTIWWRASSRCSKSAAASAPWSGLSMTGPTRKTRRAAGTWWRATSCPRSTAISPGCGDSQHFVATNRGVFDRAKEAIMAKVYENEAAVAALAVTRGSRLGDVASASNAPDLEKARRDREARGQAAE